MGIGEAFEFEKTGRIDPEPGRRHGFPVSPVMLEIHRERESQIARGYDAAHDDQHDDGSLAMFAERLVSATGHIDRANWTHAARSHLIKKYNGNSRHILVIAAALLIAEIERIDRLPSNE